MTKKKRSRIASLIWAILLLGWTALVFFFSSQPYSQQNIQPYLHRLLRGRDFVPWLPDISFTYGNKIIDARRMPFVFLEFVFRKGAHLFMYAILAAIVFLLVRALNKKRLVLPFIAALFSVGVIASADEWNQLQQIHRSGSLIDIGLDLVGGLLGLLTVLSLIGLRSLRRRIREERRK